MDYKDYKKSRDLSWEILIKENLTELPVPIVKICKHLNISVKYDVSLWNSGNDGYSTIIKSKMFIFVNPYCSKQRIRFTIAHELGHILLGHVGKYQLVNREPSPNDNSIEQAANVFASRLLAPAIVLWGCKVQTPQEIAILCDISVISAEYRFERLQKLYIRNRFLTSDLEHQVFCQFQNFIERHQHQDIDYTHQ